MRTDLKNETKNENQFSRSKVESEEQVCFWTLARKERDLKSKTTTKPVGGARIAAIDRDRIEKPPIQKPKHRERNCFFLLLFAIPNIQLF